jgi:hypothetical protein
MKSDNLVSTIVIDYIIDRNSPIPMSLNQIDRFFLCSINPKIFLSLHPIGKRLECPIED